MSALKAVYEAIETKVATISDIKHFGKWNNQILNTEAEWQYQYPAVFVEFSFVTWEKAENKPGTTNVEQLQKGDLDVSLHIVTFSRDNADNTIKQALDLERKIWYNINGLNGNEFSTLQRSLIIDDDNHDERRDLISVYSCKVYECPSDDGQVDANDPIGTVTVTITGEYSIKPFTPI